jgi:hypothetical protein
MGIPTMKFLNFHWAAEREVEETYVLIKTQRLCQTTSACIF